MRASTALALSLFLALAPAIRADEERSPLSVAVRKAVEAKQFVTSENLRDRPSFQDTDRDGGVLVGLEVSLAKSADQEIPMAIRPIYREGSREWTGAWAGGILGPVARRTVRQTAKPGYAVGGMWIRSGGGLDRICLRYFRIYEGCLDPGDNYAGEWIGTSDGGSEKYTDGGGRPVAGIAADVGRDQTRNIGLIYARVPVSRKPDPAEVARDAERAAKAARDEAEQTKGQLENEAPPPEDDSVTLFGLIALVVGGVGLLLVVVSLVFLLQKPPPPKSKGKAEKAPVVEPLNAGLPQQSSVIAPPRTPSAEPPPYFVVRSTDRSRHHRMARIYVLADQLLVIDVGSGSDLNIGAGVTAAVVAGGGLVGALIGEAAGTMIADHQKTKGAALQQSLDRLGLPALLEYASEKGNLRARYMDLVGLEIDPPPPSSVLRARGRRVGTLRFRHVPRGTFHFEFLCAVELRGAIELLHRAGAPGLRIGSGWDEATAGYVRDLQHA